MQPVSQVVILNSFSHHGCIHSMLAKSVVVRNLELQGGIDLLYLFTLTPGVGATTSYIISTISRIVRISFISKFLVIQQIISIKIRTKSSYRKPFHPGNIPIYMKVGLQYAPIGTK